MKDSFRLWATVSVFVDWLISIMTPPKKLSTVPMMQVKVKPSDLKPLTKLMKASPREAKRRQWLCLESWELLIASTIPKKLSTPRIMMTSTSMMLGGVPAWIAKKAGTKITIKRLYTIPIDKKLP